MACFGNTTKEDQAINQQIKDDKKRRGRVNEVKLLLLGPGESGKSTVFKQLKIIQTVSQGFTDEERAMYKQVVFSNCIEQMRLLAKAAIQMETLTNDTNKNHAKTLLSLPHGNNVWSPVVGAAIKSLWQDTGIQAVFAKSNHLEIQLNDTADYFFNHVDRFSSATYVPSDGDILRTRVRSTGIEEATFVFDKMTFRVVDVGGQRSERRKWIHCFDCVKAVLFCAALSDYDQVLRELRTVKRMEEALNLFEDVTNSTYFGSADIILFLNKVDLFKDKIERGIDLRQCFPQYQGGTDVSEACNFIKKRFLERVADGKTIYPHFTCAIDTQNIEHVINDVRKTVLEAFLYEINPT